uniref:protein-tyrosine-phosphatase n=1 Tax=Arcella intermedia TaxID=1963864 RepID=A0A6B2LLT2_9EUKA
MIIDNLYLGTGLHGTTYPMLDEMKIKRILRVTEYTYYENGTPKRFAVNHLKIPDQPSVNILQHFDTLFTFIEEGLTANEAVLVHCEQGVSRSAAFVIGFLMYFKKLSLREAILLTRKQRPIINPNNGFMRQLYQYETQLFNTNSVDSSLFVDDWGSGIMFIN